MKTALFIGALLVTSTAAQAQQRPERDPNSMGGGDCAANVYKLPGHAQSAAPTRTRSGSRR